MTQRLRVCEIAPTSEVPVSRSVASPIQGVAILDISVDSTSTPAPLHWRAGDWKKPPLDLALSPAGYLEGVQIVFQDETVGFAYPDFPSHELQGTPSFEVGGWPANRYRDVRTGVESRRLASGELVLFIGAQRPIRLLRLGQGFKLVLDTEHCLAGVVIGPLGSDQWELVNKAAS